MAKSLTSFERWRLVREVIGRKQTGAPLPVVQVVDRGDGRHWVLVPVNPWHPNEICLDVSQDLEHLAFGERLNELARLIGPDNQVILANRRVEFSKRDGTLLAELSPLFFWSDGKLAQYDHEMDARQKRENQEKYLRDLEKRQKYVESIGQED